LGKFNTGANRALAIKLIKSFGEFAKNNNLSGIITEADFNDDAKLGTGKEKVGRLTGLNQKTRYQSGF
jgi:hypothetical protein